MIKCDNGSIVIDGNALDVMTELSMLIHALKTQLAKATNVEVARDMIGQAVEIGLADDEEIIKQGEIAKEELKMMDAIDKLALGAFQKGI